MGTDLTKEIWSATIGPVSRLLMREVAERGADDSLALNERAPPHATPKVEIIGLVQAGTNEGRPLAANRPSTREIADAVQTTPLVMSKFNSAF